MKRKRLSNYQADLLTDLKNSEYAAAYLSASMDESVETFLLALRDVADAQKGMAKVASRAKVNRENLYRMLSEDGNPRLHNLHAVIGALGIRFRFEPQGRKAATTQNAVMDIPSDTASTNLKTRSANVDFSSHIRSHQSQISVRRTYGMRTHVTRVLYSTEPPAAQLTGV